jgi:lipoyl-dependent peroxiredoxin
MKTLYKTQATATGGRDGSAKTEDGRLSVKLNTPKELGGPGGDGTNPEQLFASGWSACFLGALKYVASQSKIKLPDTTTVTAKIGIGPRDDGKGFGITGDLEISIPGFERAQAEELVQKAHIVCPYSDATRGNIPVTLKVV